MQLPKNFRSMKAELIRLCEAGKGSLLPKAVLAAANNPKSPLHPYFEWDNTKAAEAHRLRQAGELIRSVEVKYTIGKSRVKTVQYVRDPSCGPSEPGYVRLSAITEFESQRLTLVREVDTALNYLRRGGAIIEVLNNGRLRGILLRKISEIEEFLGELSNLKQPKKSAVAVIPKQEIAVVKTKAA